MKQTNFERPFGDIEAHIRRARAERALFIAEGISTGITAVTRGIARGFAHLAKGWEGRASRERLDAKRCLAPR
jgi:hypothetical protein